jgi:adenine-specific DNA methylase
MSKHLPSQSLLDTGDIPVANIAKLAKREGARPRQAYQAHKWFARRFAVTARSLLVAATTPAGSKFWPAYYGKASCEGLSVLDPFMGGGVMLLEAARLGAGIQGIDVEPVATVISNFQGRLWEMPDIEAHMKEITDRVRSRLASFYLSRDEQGTAETLLHTFWVQVVPCGHCGYRFDAHPFFRIAWDKKSNRQWAACRSCSRILEGEFHHGSLPCDCGVRTDVHDGHCQYGTTRCPKCGHRERLIDVWTRTGNRPEFRIFAVETLRGGTERRFPTANRRIRTASEFDRKNFEAARRELERLRAINPDFIPRGPIPSAGRSDDRLVRYGYRDYSELFNSRQLLHLGLLAEEVQRVEGLAGEALKIAFSDHLTTNNMFCGYAGGWRRLSPLFSIRAYRHITRPVEINPWLQHNGRGTFPNAVRSVIRAAESLHRSSEPTVKGLLRQVPLQKPASWDIQCGDARQLGHIADATIDLVLTDPPYFDYIAYSELGHFYVPWLVRFGLVEATYLDKFPDGQLASLSRCENAMAIFADHLAAAFREIARVCRPSARIVFTYQNLDGRGWKALARAMAQAGMIPFQAFPLFGDSGVSLHKHANSISWDCVLVCRYGVPIRLPDIDGKANENGRVFADAWVRRLRRQGHALSPGDITNLTYAGALIASFAAYQPDSHHYRQAS